MSVRDDLEALCAHPIAQLGLGRTPDRWLTLFDWAQSGSVSVARLAEAHADAVAILSEAGRAPVEGAIYGVWASVDRHHELRLDDSGTISGAKSLCSGLGVVDRALVAVVGDRGEQLLVDVEASGPTVASDRSGWETPALSETATGTVRYTQHRVEIVVGADGWYLDRPGFWNGAIGPAACWAGAAAGIAEYAEAAGTLDEHQLDLRALRQVRGRIVEHELAVLHVSLERMHRVGCTRSRLRQPLRATDRTRACSATQTPRRGATPGGQKTNAPAL